MSTPLPQHQRQAQRRLKACKMEDQKRSPEEQQRYFMTLVRNLTGLQADKISQALKVHDEQLPHIKELEPFCMICGYRRMAGIL
jgi:hypothetical protein